MSQMTWHQVDFPTGLTTDQAVGFVRSLATRGRAGWLMPKRPLIFEFRATRDQRTWHIGLPEAESRDLTQRVEQWLPGAALHASSQSPTSEGVAIELRLRSQRRPLRAELQPEITQGLLGSVSGLHGQEVVVVQWVVGGWLPRTPVPPTSSTGEAHGVLNIIRDLASPDLDSEEVNQARKKQAELLFACVGRVAVRGAKAGRARQQIMRVVGAYQVLRVPGAGVSRRILPSWWVSSRMRRGVVNQIDPACVLRADELVAVLGWPVGLDDDVHLPGVELTRARLLRPDRRVVRPTTPSIDGKPANRVVATSAHPAVTGQLVLPEREGLRHLHVLGPTGVGKSTLLAQLILQDIALGHGLVVVDPKGDLVDDVIIRLPASELGRVVVLDPGDQAPVGLNPLRGNQSGPNIDGILGMLHSLWASSWGPRLGDVLHAGLLTLSLNPGHSLVELPLLLTNPAFRRPLVARAVGLEPLGLAGFWTWFDALSPEQASQVLGPVMNKLRAFILRPDLRAVLGQVEPRFDMNRVFDGRGVLLVRLPKGVLGAETAALLGSLVVQQVWLATLTRAALPAARRAPVFVYLDEFQDVMRLPVDLGDALVQARGLGVGLVLAHQHLGQLDTNLRAAVLANVASRVAFRLDHDDATVIAKRSGGRLKAEDFWSLPAFEAYADLSAEGMSRGFASARTSPLERPIRGLGTIRRSNRERWGIPRSETETRLRQLLGDMGNQVEVDHEGGGGFGVIPGDPGGRS